MKAPCGSTRAPRCNPRWKAARRCMPCRPSSPRPVRNFRAMAGRFRRRKSRFHRTGVVPCRCHR
jgi:hypothetical protein